MTTTVLLAGAYDGRLAPARAALDSGVLRFSPSDYVLDAFRSTPGELLAAAEPAA